MWVAVGYGVMPAVSESFGVFSTPITAMGWLLVFLTLGLLAVLGMMIVYAVRSSRQSERCRREWEGWRWEKANAPIPRWPTVYLETESGRRTPDRPKPELPPNHLGSHHEAR